MSDQGEKTCPLCAEEMDLTDQQLKPCKCGYQICVWCWHHIMDMAEKDQSEGRCPACRTSYDKEKIVGMAANCERLASEANIERKKTQKSKSKPSDGRKQLTSVRVIQRNLVYIVGLPLSLADEELLQRKEYFGQYGKVLKVSMSRTTSGVIQQFPNNTCSVYITYSKEEEAVRCIQSVHGFLLDGKSLKACFGTTKYCHAWLRNVPCNNPDCLYLHEVGCQEDSFTKDEIISAYTRSRVQQITGATNSLLRRSGSMLPPPVDDYCSSNSSNAKPIVKVLSDVTSNAASVPKSSPPNGSSSRSTALPAAASWGTRVSNQQPAAMAIASNGPDKQRSVLENGSLASAAAVANLAHEPASCSEILKKPSKKEENQTVVEKCKPGLLKPMPHNVVVDSGGNRAISPDRDPTSSLLSCSEEYSCGSRLMNEPSAVVSSLDNAKGIVDDDLSIDRFSADVSRIGIITNSSNDRPPRLGVTDIHSDQGSFRQPGSEVSKLPHAEQCRKDPPINTGEKAVAPVNEKSVIVRPEWDQRSGLQSQMQVRTKSEVEDDISFDGGRQNVGEAVSHSSYLPNSSSSFQGPNHLPLRASPFSEVSGVLTSEAADSFVDSKGGNRSLLANGLVEKSMFSVEHAMFGDEGQRRFQNTEDDIISSILSLDFDPWDESLTSPQNLVKLLGEGDQRASSLRPSNLIIKQQHNNQSRFSFARQDESNLLKPQHYNQPFENQIYGIYGQLPNGQPAFQGSGVSRDIYQEKRNGIASDYSEGLGNFASASSVFSSYRTPASRSQISAPPGFSAPPSRSPPPGFSSYERTDPSSEAVAGTRLLDPTTMLRNTYPSVHGDIEFMDPAILAVGRGRHQNDGELDVTSQLNSLELLMRRSSLLSATQQSHGGYHHNHHHHQQQHHHQHNQHDLRDANGFTSQHSIMSDPYGMQQQQQQLSRRQQVPSPSSLLSNNNGQWDRWSNNSEAHHGGNSLRNERLGFSGNLYHNGFDDSQFRDHLY